MSGSSSQLTLHSPAKTNLMLSVHPRRADGFHELTSLIVALDFGDTLYVDVADRCDALTCSDLTVPTGTENLVLRAAERFRAYMGRDVHFSFHLEKRIPMGAGLGGGSGNAAVALKGMNSLLGEPLSLKDLQAIAADLGSDCPFFIEQKPAIMRGRGEILETLPESVAAGLRGQRLLLFRPEFPVATAWAYGELISAAPGSYESPEGANQRLESFVRGITSLDQLLFNSFEEAIGRKYLAISALLRQLREADVPCLMSGSGSCCFALLLDGGPKSEAIQAEIRSAWGESVFLVETSIA